MPELRGVLNMHTERKSPVMAMDVRKRKRPGLIKQGAEAKSAESVTKAPTMPPV